VVALLPVRRLHRCGARARARPCRAAAGARRRPGPEPHNGRACAAPPTAPVGGPEPRLARARAGLFIFGYCFYYYFARSEMSGFMQTAFYFGYMLMARARPPPTTHSPRSPARVARVGLSRWVRVMHDKLAAPGMLSRPSS